MKNLKIALGCDHGGYELKNSVGEFLKKEGYDFRDFGCFSKDSVDYPVIAKEIANLVAKGEFDRGIIICGSGLGVAIAANKVKGIRAVTCQDTYCAKMSRAHNDANVMTMGGRVIDVPTAEDIVKIWLETDFEGGRHQRRIDMIE